MELRVIKKEKKRKKRWDGRKITWEKKMQITKTKIEWLENDHHLLP